MNPQQAYSFILLALCIWREDRGGSPTAKTAVAWSIRNRVKNPRWWGHDWVSVILMPWQYSSFNRNDPNATKWPLCTGSHNDPEWTDSLLAAQQVFPDDPGTTDLTHGATHYFDASMDSDPPKWSLDSSMVHTVDYGRLRFWKPVQM